MNHDDFYSVPNLKERGWTDAAIRRFLPKADATKANPKYRSAAPMKLWTCKRVHRIERTKAFLAWKAGTEMRQRAARVAVTTRVENMVLDVESAEITIQRGWSDERIRELAEATHGGNYQGEVRRSFVWSARTARNTIRHNLTNYEALWKLCNRGETGGPAYERLRQRVDAIIDEVYPQFAGGWHAGEV